MIHIVCALAARGLVAYASSTPLKTALLFNAVDGLVSSIAADTMMKKASPDVWLPLLVGRTVGLITACSVTALFYKIDLTVAAFSNLSALIVVLTVVAFESF